MPFAEPTREDDALMAQVLAEARAVAERGGAGVAALLRWRGETLAQGHNQIPDAHDLTAHGEMVVLRMAAERISQMTPTERRNLCMYVSLEPCLMCFAALAFIGVGRIVYSALIEDANAESAIVRDLTCGELAPLVTAGSITLVEGVRREEGCAILRMMGKAA